jgi:hypothetical protein
MLEGRCTHGLALPLYGDRPSRGVCGVCAHYDGPARGLGDVVERAARVTGVRRIVKTVERLTGRKCGCDARRAALNSEIPFKSA